MDSKAQSRDQDISFDDLKNDIHQLRSDLAQLSSAVIDKQRGHVSQLREDIAKDSQEALQRARERGDEAWSRAREMGDRTVKDAERRIEERPFLSLLLIFCAGLLLGKLFDRS